MVRAVRKRYGNGSEMVRAVRKRFGKGSDMVRTGSKTVWVARCAKPVVFNEELQARLKKQWFLYVLPSLYVFFVLQQSFQFCLFLLSFDVFL